MCNPRSCNTILLTAALGAACVALTSCVIPAPEEVRYAGRLGECGGSTATLTRAGGHFSFVPGDGVLVIRGAVAPDGALAGELNTQPPGKPPFLLAVRGRVDEAEAVLDYTSPRCTAHAALPRR